MRPIIPIQLKGQRMRFSELRELLDAASDRASCVAQDALSGVCLANNDNVMVTRDGDRLDGVYRWDALAGDWQFSGNVDLPDFVRLEDWNERMLERLQSIGGAILHQTPTRETLPTAEMDLGDLDWCRIISPYLGQLDQLLSFAEDRWGCGPLWCDVPLGWNPPRPILDDEPELQGVGFSRSEAVAVLIEGETWLPYVALV